MLNEFDENGKDNLNGGNLTDDLDGLFDDDENGKKDVSDADLGEDSETIETDDTDDEKWLDDLGKPADEKPAADDPANKKPTEDKKEGAQSDDAGDKKTEGDDEETLADVLGAGRKKEAVEEKPADDATAKTVIPEETETFISSLPEGAQAEVRRLANDARFSEEFMNPLVEPNALVDGLFAASPSRATAVADEIINRRLAEPDALAAAMYEVNPEKFSDFTEYLLEEYQDHFTALMEKRGFIVAQKGAQSAGEAAIDTSVFAEDNNNWKEIEKYYEEDAAKIKETIENANSEILALRARIAAPGAENTPAMPAPNAAPQRDPAQVEAFQAGFSEIEQTVIRIIDTEFGAAVSVQEAKDAPMLALIKKTKKELLLNGDEELNLPPLYEGLYDFGKTQKGFEDTVKTFQHFVTHKEKQNAVATARRITPAAVKYLQERAKLPVFDVLSQIEQIVAAHYGGNGEGIPTYLSGESGGNGGNSRRRSAPDDESDESWLEKL